LDQVVARIHSALIEDAGAARWNSVLLYCTSGMSRTATFALAYALKHLGLNLREAFAKLHTVRAYARPSLNFMHALIDYEKECRGGESSVYLVLEPVNSKDR